MPMTFKRTILHPLALNSKIQKTVNPNKTTVATITDLGYYGLILSTGQHRKKERDREKGRDGQRVSSGPL